MYYEIRVNGDSIGVFGHPEVLNMNISVSVSEGIPEIFANAVCREEGRRVFYDWVQSRISSTDEVSIREVFGRPANAPRKSYVMNSQ